MIRAFHHSDFPLELLRERKRQSVTAEPIAYLDADRRRVPEHFARGLLGPLVCLDRREAASQGLVERPPFASLHVHA